MTVSRLEGPETRACRPAASRALRRLLPLRSMAKVCFASPSRFGPRRSLGGKKAFTKAAKVLNAFTQSGLIECMFLNINMSYWIEMCVALYFILISETAHRRADAMCRVWNKPSLTNDFLFNQSVAHFDLFQRHPNRL